VYTTHNWILSLDLEYDRLDIRHTCFSPDSERIVSCHRNGEVVVWKRETGDRLFMEKHGDTT